MLKLKNLKFSALILLTSALLVLAINPNVSCVKATPTTTPVFVYNTLGGTIQGNGTTLTGGGYSNYTTGDTLTFNAVASPGFKFLCFEYCSSQGALTSTLNPFSKTIVVSTCAIEAIFTPTKNATASSKSILPASVSLFSSMGGTTVPSSGLTGATYTNYTTGGTFSNFQETPGSGFQFLCWIIQTSTGATLYNANTLSLKFSSSSTAIESLWIPSGSTVTLPIMVSEFSAVPVTILAAILIIVALGAYVRTRRGKARRLVP